MIRVEPITQGTAEAYYGARPQSSIRGMAVLEGDDVIGLAGTYIDKGHRIFFGEIRDDILERMQVNRRYGRAMLRAAFRVLVDNADHVLYAVAGNDGTAPRLLSRLNFRLVDEATGLYRRN